MAEVAAGASGGCSLWAGEVVSEASFANGRVTLTSPSLIQRSLGAHC